MKFTNYLKTIHDVQVYPIISLVIFTVVFAIVLAYVFTADKKQMNEQGNIPLK